MKLKHNPHWYDIAVQNELYPFKKTPMNILIIVHRSLYYFSFPVKTLLLFKEKANHIIEVSPNKQAK